MNSKPPSLSQEEKKFNLLQPYGDSHYRVEVKMPGPELLTKLEADTASSFTTYFKEVYFRGSIKGNSFTLRHRNRNTRNTWGPEAVGRIVDNGNTCSVEFKFQLSPIAKFAIPTYAIMGIVFPIYFFFSVSKGITPLAPALPAFFFPLLVPLIIWISINLGKKDKKQILLYFEQLPGADLQEQRQLF